MKKPALLILSLSALLTLASCTATPNTPPSSSDSSSETSSVISDSSSGGDVTSSKETPKTATVKAVYNPESDAKANVYAGDAIPTEGTITFVDKNSNGNYDYQIYFNGTIADMSKGTDGFTYTYDYTVASGSDVTIGFSKKSETSTDGYTLTFEQGKHYTIFGITSGQKYNPYTKWKDDDTYIDHSAWFTVIPEDGYYLNEVRTKKTDSDDSEDEPESQYVFRNGCSLSSLSADTTILVDVQKGSIHTISYVDNENIDWKVKPENFVGGSQVCFSLAAKDGFTISNVNFGVDKSDVLRTDYSKYVVYLPDENVTIDVTTNEVITLSAAKNEHISDVRFYDGSQGYRSIMNGDEEKIELVDDYKITKYILGSDEWIVVAFKVVGNYKALGLVDNEDSYVMGETTDGGYAIKFCPDSKTAISIDVAAIRSVTLDGSGDKVDFVSDNSDTNYTAGDNVFFYLPVKEDFASQYRVKSVYYCYDGKEILIAPDESNGQYSFTMPDCDVTIKVEMYEPVKTTVSYVNNAGSLASSIVLEGKTSGTSISEDTSSNSFEEGEKVAITVKAGTKNPKSVKAYYTTSDGTKTEIVECESNETYWTRDVYQREYNGWFYVPKGGATVTIEEGSDVEAISLFYKTDDAITFYTSKDASTACSSLTVYPMDVFYFSVGKTVADNEVLSVKLYENGSDYWYNEEIKIGDKTAYEVRVRTDAISIKTEVSKAYSFTAKTVNGDDATSSFVDENDCTLVLTNGKILEGTLFKLDYWSTYEIKSITIGGEEPTTEGEKPTIQVGNYGNVYYVARGDVVITVAPKTAE